MQMTTVNKPNRIPESRYRRILITGATGFVGRSLINYLLNPLHVDQTNLELFLVARGDFIIPEDTQARVVYLKGDLSSLDLQIPKCDAVFHCATPASALLNALEPSEMLRANTSTMKAIIQIVSNWNNNARVIFTSSGAVYGEAAKYLELIPETFPIADPNDSSDAYRLGKIVAEDLLMQASNNGICEGIICRLFAFSGPGLPLDRHFAIGNFVRDAVQHDVITVRGDGTSIRSYLDQFDLAQWLWAAALRGSERFAYHIGSDLPISIFELANLVSQRCAMITGDKKPIVIQGRRSNLDGLDRYVPSTIWTREQLSTKQSIALEDSIDSMILNALRELSS